MKLLCCAVMQFFLYNNILLFLIFVLNRSRFINILFRLTVN